MSTSLIISWVALAITLFFLAKGGFDKLRGSAEAVGNFNYMKLGKYRTAVGISELVAAVLLVTPGLSLYGVILTSALMGGAVALHLSLMNGAKVYMPILVGVLALVAHFLK